MIRTFPTIAGKEHDHQVEALIFKTKIQTPTSLACQCYQMLKSQTPKPRTPNHDLNSQATTAILHLIPVILLKTGHSDVVQGIGAEDLSFCD